MFRMIVNNLRKRFCKKNQNDIWVKKYIINHPNSSTAILEQLAFEDDSEIRAMVAKHPNTNINTLIVLSKDKTFFVKYCLLRNPKLPKDILFELTKDSNEYIRKIAFHHLTKEIKYVQNYID